MFEVDLLIPTTSNAGSVFSPAHHDTFEAHLLSRFRGFSRLPTIVAGAWIDSSGTVYNDDLRVYTVALDSIVQGNLIGDACAFAKTHYGQKAIYVRYLGLSEIL